MSVRLFLSVKMAVEKKAMATRQHADKSTLPGTFLVASPHCGAPYQQTVVLLLAHAREGAQGILINDHTLETLKRHARGTSNRIGGASVTVALSNLPLVRWAPGQLDREFEQGVWMATPAGLEPVPDTMLACDLWANLVRRIGRSVLADAFRIKNVTSDPSLN